LNRQPIASAARERRFDTQNGRTQHSALGI